MSHEDQAFDLGAEVGALGHDAPTAPVTEPPPYGGTPPAPTSMPPEPVSMPPEPGTMSQEYAELEREVQAEELALAHELGIEPGVDPTIPPEPSPPDPGHSAHPDPSSVPPDAPTNATYGEDGQAQQGVAPTSHVIGDPEHDAGQWTFQGANGYCGPNSLSMLIESATGHKVSEGDVADWAIQNDEMTRLPAAMDSPGMPSLHYGMLPEQAAATLNALGSQYGISANYEQGNMGDLEGALKNGHEVMIELDDQKIWHQAGVQDSDQPNHFVVVTGVDPSTNTVFLNDPGTPDGREESVPLSDFEAAWKTSDNAMITVDTDPGHTGGNPAPPSTGGSSAKMAEEREGITIDDGGAVHAGAGGGTDYHDMASWTGPILLPIVMSASR
jgi:hypothetical protein